MDRATTKELLDFIMESLRLIKRRFKNIQISDDFLENDDGLDKLDSISMRLQAIGESIKNLDKKEKDFLLKVADNNYWSEIIKARDFISHHYVDIDSEVVFDICSNELEELEQKIIQLQKLIE